MGEPSSKRQKTGSKPKPTPSTAPAGPQISDPRFANIQSDPRYRLPGKKDKVKLDKRFSRALQDEDFTRRAKVDRYGRPIASDAEKKRLKRKYEFEEDEEDEKEKEGSESSSDEPDDDDEVQQELARVNKGHDPLREGKDIESSSDETSSSDEDSESDSDEDEEAEEEDIDEEVGVGPSQQADVPTGDVTSRIAIVNLDWDNIRAADLFAVFSSFLPPNGSLLKVAIYPSEFGKERLEREELEGPPKEIFANSAKEDVDGEEEEDGEEAIKKSILKPDDGADFDSKALRRYQLERLRYFYCILTFSSREVAKHIYDSVDGTEYQRTANFFDLRFVPDDTDFSGDVPREECDKIPDDYRPNDFVTDALQHSKVKLTWDAEDRSRKEAVARAFKGSRKEIDENDLKAYLGSDSSEDEDEDADGASSKKEAERQRMRALLGLAPEPTKKSKKEKAPVGDMLVTFTSGLAPTKEDGKKRSVFENSPEPEETTVERYIRKERERKQKRKEKRKAAREGGHDIADSEFDSDHSDGGVPTGAAKTTSTVDNNKTADADADLGFDDPFFADEPSAKAEKAASNKIRKEERMKKKREREAEEEAERKQRAELELLMADDNIVEDGAPKLRHFDMKEIEKAEKLARKKNKKKNKIKDKKGVGEEVGAEANADDGFKVDAADPRFARLFTSHEYAIDPTNPKFKGTKAMKALLKEGRKRKQKQLVDDAPDRQQDAHAREKGKKDRKEKNPGADGGAEDMKSLVAKLKQKQKQK
ncbi:Pre-rRNA-processing protein esf1 [Exophiala dermatitidis]